MRYLLLVLLFFSSVGDGLKKASRINEGVQQAQEYYQQGAYEQAVRQYNFLRNSLNVKDETLLLNLAHATYLSGDLEQAQKYYTQLRNNPDADLQGAALNQLGLLAFEDNNPEKALYFFRQAIIKNPLNETARYNYELVKKYQSENPAGLPHRSARKKNPDKNQPVPNPQNGQGISASDSGQTDFITDLENQGQEPPQNKFKPEGAANNQQQESADNKPDKQPAGVGDTPQSQGSQPGNTPGLQNEGNSVNPGPFGNNNENTEEITEQERQMQTLRKRLGKTDLSPEKALLLLEAMQNAELQYLQQLPKPKQQKQNKNKPDW